MFPLEPSDPPSIGRYQLVGRLGQGGMGRVYLGRTPGGRPAAVKVISAQFQDHPEALIRFQREVETLRTVRNPFTAALIDQEVGVPPYWLATEYVPGPTLAAAIREWGALDPEVCRGLFAALAEALVDIHGHGISHRDLKPANIILSVTGPQLIDFGIARDTALPGVTQIGMTVGTPGYTAPEALAGDEVGPAGDVFALAATIAIAATGRAPYGRGSAFTISERSARGEVDVAGVPDDLAALIQACSSADPAWRPSPEEIIAHCRPRTTLIENPSYQQILASFATAPAETPAPVFAGTGASAPTSAAPAFPPSTHYLPPAPNPTQVYTRPRNRDRAARTAPARPLLAVAGVLVLIVAAAIIGLKVVHKDSDSGTSAIAPTPPASTAPAAAPTTDPPKASAAPTTDAASPTPAETSTSEPAADNGFDKTPANDPGPNLIGPGGTCLAVPATLTNGDRPVTEPCDGSISQRWIYTDKDELMNQNRCLDLGGGDVPNGNPVQLWDCNGTDAQHFEANGNTLRNPKSQRCLTTQVDHPPANDPILMWDCGSAPNQVWQMPHE